MVISKRFKGLEDMEGKPLVSKSNADTVPQNRDKALDPPSTVVPAELNMDRSASPVVAQGGADRDRGSAETIGSNVSFAHRLYQNIRPRIAYLLGGVLVLASGAYIVDVQLDVRRNTLQITDKLKGPLSEYLANAKNHISPEDAENLVRKAEVVKGSRVASGGAYLREFKAKDGEGEEIMFLRDLESRYDIYSRIELKFDQGDTPLVALSIGSDGQILTFDVDPQSNSIFLDCHPNGKLKVKPSYIHFAFNSDGDFVQASTSEFKSCRSTDALVVPINDQEGADAMVILTKLMDAAKNDPRLNSH